MIKIGITGSLASGKSTVAKMISSRKYPLYNADIAVKKIYKTNVFKTKVFKKFKLKNKKNIKNKIKKIISSDKKYLNDENHSEYEALNLPIERVRQNIENWTIDYDHLAKKNSPEKFNSVKLEKIELDSLPEFIQDNQDKYIEWIIK